MDIIKNMSHGFVIKLQNIVVFSRSFRGIVNIWKNNHYRSRDNYSVDKQKLLHVY